MSSPPTTAQSPAPSAEHRAAQIREARLSAVVEAAYILEAVGR